MRVRPFYLFAAAPYVTYGIVAAAFGRGGVHGMPPHLFYLLMAALISAACLAFATLIAGAIYRRRARQNRLPTIALDVAIAAQVIFLVFIAVGTFLPMGVAF